VEFARIKRKRLFVLGLAFLAATFAVLLVLSIPTKYSRRSQRLPDGSTLKIVSISYGTNHFLAWPRRKPWEKLLMPHLPRSINAWLGWESTSGSAGMSPRPGEKSIAIFTLQEPLEPESVGSVRSEFLHPRFKLSLCDEGGTVYETASGGSTIGGYRGKKRWKVSGWQFSELPRDSRYLRLQFSEQSADGSTPQQVAEFFIPNPAMNPGTNSGR
jgi:hypothetical protein